MLVLRYMYICVCMGSVILLWEPQIWCGQVMNSNDKGYFVKACVCVFIHAYRYIYCLLGDMLRAECKQYLRFWLPKSEVGQNICRFTCSACYQEFCYSN